MTNQGPQMTQMTQMDSRSPSKPSACARPTTASRRVRGLDLQVPAGSIFGFLGRNGAGKTTTLKLLLGMARPTSGTRHGARPGRRLARGQRGDSPPHRVRQRRQGPARRHGGRRADPLHLAALPALAEGPRGEVPPQVRAAARPRGQGAVARHAHQAGAAAGALPRRRAADPRRADVRPRSGDDRGSAADAGVARRRPRAPPCSSRRTSSPRSIRSPTTWPSSIAAAPWWRARSTTCASSIDGSSWCSTAMRPTRRSRRPASSPSKRKGRVLTVLSQRRRRRGGGRGAAA